MKKSWMSKLLVGAFAIAILPSYVSAEGGQRGKQFLECFEREYQPTAEQMQQIEDLYEKSGDWRESREKMRESRKSLHDAMRSDASEAELRKKFNEMQKMKQEMHQKHFEKMLKLRSILTPEQREKIGACRGGRWERHGKGPRE
ncbi:MAG: Spy/CpxP family protein refolding chaperone [Deltaproteobacteria bacterium]|nr:Spy/CpxP family protein refolding chaperone [Deltaproteobacteria bacterium]